MSGGLRIPSLLAGLAGQTAAAPDPVDTTGAAATVTPATVAAPEVRPEPQRLLRWTERATAAATGEHRAPIVPEPPGWAAETHWSGAVCAPVGDRAMLVADWLVIASGMRGTVVEATTLGARPDAPHGMYLDASDPEQADSQLSDLPRAGLSFAVTGEHTELARLVAGGYLDPERTVLVAAARRLLTAAEQVVAPEHVLEDAEIEELASARSLRFIRCDVDQIVAWHELPSTSGPGILLGALCAAGVAGLDEPLCHAAIVQLGIDVQESLEGFAIGLRIGAGRGGRTARRSSSSQYVRKTRSGVPRDERDGYRALIERVDATFGERPAARDAVREAVRALTRYQSAAYAQVAVEHAEAVHADQRTGTDPRDIDVIPTLARGITQILLHPDIAWAAQVRVGCSRLPELRTRHGIRRGQPFVVVDHLQLDEREVAELRSAARRRRPNAPPQTAGDALLAGGLGPVGALSVQTVSLRGQLQLRQLAALRRGREYTAYYARALETCALYVGAVRDALSVDADVAQLVARTGSMIHGAGAVRTATTASATALWGRVVRPAVAVDRTAGDRHATFSGLVIRWTLGELIRVGPRAIWDVNGQMLALALNASRGGSHTEAMQFARQLTGEF